MSASRPQGMGKEKEFRCERLFNAGTMNQESTVSIALAWQWLWRCAQQSVLVFGLELCVAKRSRQLVPLANSRVETGRRDQLPHRCAARVLAATPLNAS